MTNYYVSSVAYAAVAQWGASTSYSVGSIVRQLAAPAVNSERCFRAAGGSSSFTNGSASGTFSATTSGTCSLTTTGAAIIVVAVCLERTSAQGSNATVSSVSGGSLTWTRRAQTQQHFSTTTNQYLTVETWWAYAASALSAATITVTASATVDDASILAFGVTGAASTTAPWDANASLPAAASSATAPTPGVAISTTSGNALVLEFIGTGTATAPSKGSAGSFFLANVHNSGGTNFSNVAAAGDCLGSGALANVPIAWGDATLTDALLVVDAIPLASLPSLTSGGTEPAWTLTLNATTTDNQVNWIECTGQQPLQHQGGTTTWTAPAARFNCLTSSGNSALAAGDTVFFSSDHAETQSTALSISPPASAAATTYLLSVSRTSGNMPPAAGDLTVGAAISTTGAVSLTLGAQYAHIQGFTFTGGSGASGSAPLILGTGGGGPLVCRNCGFVVGVTLSSATVQMLATLGRGILWDNCTVQFGAAGQSLEIGSSSTVAKFTWKNTASAIAGATLPTTLFVDSFAGADVSLRGVDLSALGSGHTLIDPGTGLNLASRFSFQNCKLGAGVTLVNTADQSANEYIELVNCDSANTNTNCNWFSGPGQISTSIATTRTGGATNGSTSYSRKMATSANVTFVNPLEFHIWQWNTVTGGVHTATVEFTTASALTNAQIWGELEYLADSADCLSGFANDGAATVLTSAANQPTSSATWTGGAGTNQKLQITFTAAQAGLLHFVVRLAAPSTTVYVDPVITVA